MNLSTKRICVIESGPEGKPDRVPGHSFHMMAGRQAGLALETCVKVDRSMRSCCSREA